MHKLIRYLKKISKLHNPKTNYEFGKKLLDYIIRILEKDIFGI